MVTKNKKRILKMVTRKRLLILLGCILFFACVIGIAKAIQINDTKAAITQARNENESSFEELREKRISTLKDRRLTATTPDYSSKLDVCFVNHTDQGWMAANWYQDCYIRYIDMFSTSFTQQEVAHKLTGTSVFGEANSSSKTCDTLYRDKLTPTLSYLTWNTPEAQTDTYHCKIPKLTHDYYTTSPNPSSNGLATHTYRSFTASEVNQSKKYIVMLSDNFYYHESLGCGLGIIFCSSPRSSPILGH